MSGEFSDVEQRIRNIIQANDQRLVTAERLTVQALCEIARHLARLVSLREFELGLTEEDLDELAKVGPDDLDEINKLPPAEG